MSFYTKKKRPSTFQRLFKDKNKLIDFNISKSILITNLSPSYFLKQNHDCRGKVFINKNIILKTANTRFFFKE